MVRGLARNNICRCPKCQADQIHWDRLTKNGFGLIKCDCSQWVEHAEYWAHRTGCTIMLSYHVESAGS